MLIWVKAVKKNYGTAPYSEDSERLPDSYFKCIVNTDHLSRVTPEPLDEWCELVFHGGDKILVAHSIEALTKVFEKNEKIQAVE